MDALGVGALSLTLHYLPDGGEIAAYCRGPYCVYAMFALHIR